MCYSSKIEAEYRKYVNAFGAELSLADYVRLFWERRTNTRIKIPKAMEAQFRDPQSDGEREIKAAIDEFTEAEKNRFEAELFKQRKRLNDANRVLESKATKAAQENQRIAAGKIAWASAKLADLRRAELLERDSRIFPGYYAPVLVMQNGRLTVKPMRYQCRVAGKPSSYDVKFPGTYNARRDNLEKFWKPLFGYSHGILAMSAFYENVDRHRVEGRELVPGEKAENVILEFKPNPPHTMYAACLWSHWTGNGEPALDSFAAITDEPPPEVAAAGHDRCIIPIKRENVAAWLNPDPKNLAALYAILDDRERPYYEHRLAA
ncbi:MAG: SOS response-associated peptidase [Betaproteobacteria bacterium]|nr:SOS response-associated peptidase [Betaproteobacteria bacterium]